MMGPNPEGLLRLLLLLFFAKYCSDLLKRTDAHAAAAEALRAPIIMC